jgi:hypothetical protein
MRSLRGITTLATAVTIAASFLLVTPARGDAADTAPEPVWQASGCPLSLLNYWRFDEGSGTAALDSVGTSHGAISGAQWVAGRVNSALSFDGDDDSVDVPESPEWVLDSFTVQLWIRTSEGHPWQGTILSTYGSTQGTVGFGIGIGGSSARRGYLTEVSYRAEYHGPKAELGSMDAGVRVDDDEWHLITLVRNSEIGRAFLYVDAMPVYERDDIIGTIDIPRDLSIGTFLYYGQHYPFLGKIDEVALFNTALSPDQIERHYTNGLLGKGYCYIPPDEAIESLIEAIEGMGLHRGTERSLVAKLRNALKSLQKGNVNAALGQLHAFINAARAQRGKKLTQEQADQIIDAAGAIIQTILEDAAQATPLSDPYGRPPPPSRPGAAVPPPAPCSP